ncbi:hypothetical protein FQZ97_798940 [compost metagenome]
MVALAQFTAALAQHGQLLFAFDALGYALQAEVAADGQDGFHQRQVAGIPAQAIDEAAVDLQAVEGQALEVGEG